MTLPSENDNILNNLKNERDRFVAFAFASADILLELDETGQVIFTDGATYRLLGYKAEQLIGENFYRLIVAEDSEIAFSLKNAKEDQRIDNVRVRIRSRFNDEIPFVLSGYRLNYLQNRLYLTLSLLKANISAEELARRDIDSGLLKKEPFIEAANQRIREAQEAGQDVKLTLLDLPDLKAFLDSLPPEQAAQLMGEINAYLRAKSLGGDMAGIVGEDAYSFVHDPSLNVQQMLVEIVDLTRKADPKGVGIEMHAQTLDTAAAKLTPQDSASALLFTINKFAEARGENFCIHSLSEGYQSMLSDTVAKISEFKQTIAASSFQVAFQPIVDLKNGVIHHFETLVRFEQGGEFASPFQFITFGEQAGMIGEFDLAMCQKTIDILNEAASKGNKPLVAINLSGKSLSSNLFMDTLRELIKLHPRVRKQLIFEVTESAKISNMVTANNFLQELRKEGNLCCLDDFGAGESSFDYLRSLQVDFVKIDGSYVKESMASQRGRHMLKAMVSLCRNLNIVTIGEMVEDEKAAGLLWEAGVKFGQGYLFGKPTVETETLIHCSKPTPYYQGIMRARRVSKRPKK